MKLLGSSMGYLWVIHGLSIGYLWVVRQVDRDCLVLKKLYRLGDIADMALHSKTILLK